jgi:hypothetical protein
VAAEVMRQKSEAGLRMMHGFISQTRSPLPLARKVKSTLSGGFA